MKLQAGFVMGLNGAYTIFFIFLKLNITESI